MFENITNTDAHIGEQTAYTGIGKPVILVNRIPGKACTFERIGNIGQF